MRKNIVVSGSLAYDRIMDFPGYFSDHILPEKIHVLNVCFQVDGVKEKFGGTGGNIAYSLKLMGETPLVSAAVGGFDHHRYFQWLEKNGISTAHIKVIEEEFTAAAYITTDKADNQITGFHPGAMKYTSDLDFDRLEPARTIVIISPGNLVDMIRYPGLCRERGIDYIFDPGQSLPMLAGPDLVNAITGCRVLISNDYGAGPDNEADGPVEGRPHRARRRAGRHHGRPRLEGAGARRRACPYRSCGQGRYSTRQAPETHTRGGLIAGLIAGMDIEACARMGSVCASFAVECYGTQEYSFTEDEFKDRLASCGC